MQESNKKNRKKLIKILNALVFALEISQKLSLLQLSIWMHQFKFFVASSKNKIWLLFQSFNKTNSMLDSPDSEQLHTTSNCYFSNIKLLLYFSYIKLLLLLFSPYKITVVNFFQYIITTVTFFMVLFFLAKIVSLSCYFFPWYFLYKFLFMYVYNAVCVVTCMLLELPRPWKIDGEWKSFPMYDVTFCTDYILLFI